MKKEGEYVLNDFLYVVKFPHGKYYSGLISTERETADLLYASKYGFDWQPLKDLYLQLYCNENNLMYELIKVKTTFEIVD
jgi:hypothetical protein